LLLPPSSTLNNLKQEIATALNDTSEPQRDVKAEDVTVYKLIDGSWQDIGTVPKGGKRVREETLDELDIGGIGAGTMVDGEGESLAFTVENGLETEKTIDIEAYPRDD
jgi:hypothetical protein